jgi:hypothetical protein
MRDCHPYRFVGMDSGPDIDNDVVVVVCDPTSPCDGRERQLELHLYGSHSDTVAWTPTEGEVQVFGSVTRWYWDLVAVSQIDPV